MVATSRTQDLYIDPPHVWAGSAANDHGQTENLCTANGWKITDDRRHEGAEGAIVAPDPATAQEFIGALEALLR